MRFVDINKRAIGGRRSASNTENIKEEDVKDPKDLVRVLNKLLGRLSSVEGRVTPEPVEIEIRTTAGSKVYMFHGFGGAIRWTVVDWKGSAAGTACALTRGSASNNDVLELDCGANGVAVVRIEPSQFGLSS